MESYEPKSGLVAVVGMVSAILLVAVILLLQAVYYRAQEKEDLAKAVMVPPEAQMLRAQQLGQLQGYRVVDPQGGIVAIPIDRAMELLVREESQVKKEVRP
jgi:hypothetical protein